MMMYFWHPGSGVVQHVTSGTFLTVPHLRFYPCLLMQTEIKCVRERHKEMDIVCLPDQSDWNSLQ